MTPAERAAAISAAVGNKTVTYPYLGITFRVGSLIVTGGVVRVTITAWTGSGATLVNLPLGDNIFRFVNPPLTVPDGGSVIVTPPFGAPYSQATFIRNDLAAAQTMVYDAVVACARRLGWTP